MMGGKEQLNASMYGHRIVTTSRKVHSKDSESAVFVTHLSCFHE